MAARDRIGQGLELRGMEATIDALNMLEKKVSERILAASLKKASKPFVKGARTRVPVQTGLLKYAMGTVTRKYKVIGGRIVVEIMGPRRRVTGKTAAKIRGQAGNESREPANYAHLVEFGTAAHTIQPKNKQALSAPGGPFDNVDVHGAGPQPFMRNAWSATKRRMERILGEELGRRIAKAAADAARRSRERRTRAAVKGTRKFAAKTRRGVSFMGTL